MYQTIISSGNASNHTAPWVINIVGLFNDGSRQKNQFGEIAQRN